MALRCFIQTNTVVLEPENPQAWDHFAYSYGNPVKYIDPNGHWPCSFTSSGLSYTVSTFSIGTALDRIGERLGVDIAGQIVSEAASEKVLGLDIAA